MSRTQWTWIILALATAYTLGLMFATAGLWAMVPLSVQFPALAWVWRPQGRDGRGRYQEKERML